MKTKLRERKVRLFGKSIPLIAVVAVVLIVGIVGAALVGTMLTTSITVREPISKAFTDPLNGSLDPGNSDVVVLKIENVADVTYGLNITPVVTYGGEEVNVSISNGTPDGNITAAGSTPMEYNITASPDDSTPVSGNITYIVKIDHGASGNQTLTIGFPIVRDAPFGP